MPGPPGRLSADGTAILVRRTGGVLHTSRPDVRCPPDEITALRLSQVSLLRRGRQGVVRLRNAASACRRAMLVHAAAAEAPSPVILVAEKLGAQGMELLQDFGTVDNTHDMTPEQLLEKVAETDALIIRSATQVTRQVFEAAKGRLKVVGRAGVGVDNVDLSAATEYGCLVVNAPTANTIAAAEHAIALLCALSRNVAQADASVKAGKWERGRLTGVSLLGKTLAIMGFGKVGNEVARRARGLGFAAVLAYDPYASQDKAAAVGVQLVALDEALARADFFSLHMPLTDSTRNIFSDAAFAKMKPGARIVNVARGGVVDDAALARALDEGIVAQAALDVFVKEPPPADHPLVGRPDVVCTPHLGASTREAQEGVSLEIAQAVIDALKGELAATAVNAPMVPAAVLAELAPFVALAEGLGRAAVQLADTSTSRAASDLHLTYASPRGDDLDTRLLRAMVLKGMLERTTTARVNLVNADLLAQQRGLRIVESTIPSAGKEVLTELTVALGTSATNFSACLGRNGKLTVAGAVKAGRPFITRIGAFDVDLALEGIILLSRQVDQVGVIAGVAGELARAGINVSFMTVSRETRGRDAVMAVGVDETPPRTVLDAITSVSGITEFAIVSEAPSTNGV